MNPFDQSWALLKDVYYGDKDPKGIDTERQGSTLGMPSVWGGGKPMVLGEPKEGFPFGNAMSAGSSEAGMSRAHTPGKWFGTNLSALGRSANENNIPEDQWDDFFTDSLSEIETHEGIHVAQYPMLQQAAREEEQRRIEEAKARGVKVIGNDAYRSPIDILTGREVKRPRDFAVTDDQLTEWDEVGAFAGQLGTANKNWDGQAASVMSPRITPDMSDRDIRERYFKTGYPQIGEDRERRQNLSPSEYYTYGSEGGYNQYNRREGLDGY